MNGVREAAWFLARAAHVLKAQAANFLKGIVPRRHAACHHDHLRLLALSASPRLMELNRWRLQTLRAVAAIVSAPHARNRSERRRRARRGRTSHRHCAEEFSAHQELLA